ncbi:hypothetical protein AB0J71_43545 [Nonomuraea sp. NPDC049637]
MLPLTGHDAISQLPHGPRAGPDGNGPPRADRDHDSLPRADRDGDNPP